MTSEIEIKGKWKLPKETKWINGTLTFNPEVGSKLELFGTFNPSLLDQSSQEIILGKTDSGDVTLLDSWYGGKRVTHGAITIGTYKPGKIMKGHHFDEEADIKFEKVIFKVFNLYQWINKSGQIQEFRRQSSSYSINYEEIPPVDFKINDNCNGRISFDAPITSNKAYNGVDLEEHSYVHFEYTERVLYTKMLEDIIKFVNLITLVTFEQSYLTEITFKDSNYIDEKSRFKQEKFIKCIFRSTIYSPKHKLRHLGNHTVHYSKIEGKFSEYLRNWYNSYDDLQQVILLTLNHFKNKNWFSSDKFVDIIRALESYHRQNYNNVRIPKEKFNDLKERIIEAVNLNEEDLKWLESRMIGNEPHLSNRLKELINDNQNKYIIDNIKDINKFCHKVTSSRNYYTYYDKNNERRALKGWDLSDLTDNCRGLMISCILKHIGIENEKFEERLKINLE